LDKTLVLFDFDGTITTKDTFLELIKYHKGALWFYTGMLLLLPRLLLFRAGIVSSQSIKETVVSFFWRDIGVTEFDKVCHDFCSRILPGLIRPAALKELQKHIADGHRVAVVSASAENWVKPFCSKYNITCIATRLETKENKLTGKLVGLNCNKEEKVNRIKSVFDLNNYEDIIVYGDSNGDKPMLRLASVAHFKPFR